MILVYDGTFEGFLSLVYEVYYKKLKPIKIYKTLPNEIIFEEILEIATWGQLNQHQKPMILYNVNNFYDALIAQLDHAVQEGFLPPQHRAKLIVCNHAEQILNALKNLQAPVHFVI